MRRRLRSGELKLTATAKRFSTISILWRATKWRSVKYENIYLRAYENGTQLRRGLTEYFDFYNTRRTHQALDYQTPDDVYYGSAQCRLAA
jgi:putative transposase